MKKILWVATKAPWPPVDGGRLLLFNTLRALSAAGHDLTLVAPIDDGVDGRPIEAALQDVCRPSFVSVSRRPRWLDAFHAQLRRLPLTVVRHALAGVGRRVAEHLETESFDLIQAEQVQALGSIELAGSALTGRLPVILRAQNVESDLWAQAARESGWRRPILTLESRRLAAWEGRAVRRCAATLALTAEDGARLASLAGGSQNVHHVPAPFEVELPPATEALAGSPPVVLFGSGGWLPNAVGADWFLREAWPRMRATQPEAVLHVFGSSVGGNSTGEPGVVRHPSPDDSRAAYPIGGVLVVPLQIASGVRIKILEAWGRGVPVIATPQAARGLAAEDGEQLLLARDGSEFAAALTYLAGPEESARIVEQGRRHLQAHHEFSNVAARLGEIYADHHRPG